MMITIRYVPKQSKNDKCLDLYQRRTHVEMTVQGTQVCGSAKASYNMDQHNVPNSEPPIALFYFDLVKFEVLVSNA